MAGLPTIEEALALVLGRVSPLDLEDVPVTEVAGRVAGADVRATVDLPPFDSSAMDGYAVRAADTPGVLRIAGASAAGRPAEAGSGAGEALEISTGAVVPGEVDAVVPVERTRADGATVTVEAVSPGENVRARGGDVRAGEIVVVAGTPLLASQLGAVAAVGLATIPCARRPRVAIVATGDELRQPGDDLGPGQIYESNSAMLAALCRSAGAEAVRLGPVGDDEGETAETLEAGLSHDVLITSGGVSVGPHDLVRGALASLGAEEVFWRVAVRPGKPVAFAVRGRTLVFGLPGNPVSSLVGFELFVRPALRALQGAAPGPFFLPGVLDGGLRRNDARDDLVRARIRVEDGAVVLSPVTGQESHMIARAAAAAALVHVPRGAGELEPGAPVRYLPLQ